MISKIQWSSWSEVTTNTHHLSLALLTVSVITLATLWHKSRKAKLPLRPVPRGLPGPRGLPVVGYLPFLDPNLHLEFTKMAQTYGPIFKLKLGSKTLIVVSSSELATAVVREQDDIFANRDPTAAALILTYGGQNIVWSDNNSYWRNLRKVFVYEVFSNKNMEASQTFRKMEVRKTIKHTYETMGAEVDIGKMAFLTSMSVMNSLLWGKSVGDDEKSSKLGVEFRGVITDIVEVLGMANVSDFFPVLSKLDLQGVQRRMKRLAKKIDGMIERIMEERMHVKHEGIEQQERKDLLQILLELKEQNTYTSFNVTQIKALLLDIIVGGTDTSTTMVEWTMAELMQNPKVMQRVKDELTEVVGLNNIVEESHLPKLPYLNAVVKETFRLHPPLPLLVPRRPSQSCEVGGHTITKGSNIYLNIWAIHRDPQYWEDPLEFNPDRFLSIDGATKFDYNGYNTIFMPFGSGRRKCPGLPLGEKMLVYFLASMLHSFDWTLAVDKDNDLSSKFGIILKKEKPLMAIPSQRLPEKTLYVM